MRKPTKKEWMQGYAQPETHPVTTFLLMLARAALVLVCFYAFVCFVFLLG